MRLEKRFSFFKASNKCNRKSTDSNPNNKARRNTNHIPPSIGRPGGGGGIGGGGVSPWAIEVKLKKKNKIKAEIFLSFMLSIKGA